MDTSTQQQAAARTNELPGAYLDHPFGPEWDVYKVRGKVFMLQAQVTGAGHREGRSGGERDASGKSS